MGVRQWKADLATALALLAGEIFLFVSTFSFARSAIRGYPGAAFFPRIILSVLIVLTVALAIKALVARRAADPEVTSFPVPDFAITLGAGLGFAVLIDAFGLEVAVLAIMLPLLFARVVAWKAVAGSLATLAAVYVVFVLFLGVSAPLAVLPQYVTF